MKCIAKDPSLRYLRASALVIFALYVLMLLVPVVALKYALLAAIGISAAGWHAVLRGRLYSAMPNQSGISMAVSSVWGVATGLVPGVLGVVLSAPTVDTAHYGGRALITALGAEVDARRVAVVLGSGPLPAPLQTRSAP